MFKKTICVCVLSPFVLMSSAFALDDDWLPEIPNDYKPPVEIYADRAQLIDINTATEAVYEKTQENKKAEKAEKPAQPTEVAGVGHGAALKAYVDPATGQFAVPPAETQTENKAAPAAEKNNKVSQTVVSTENNATVMKTSTVEGGGVLLDVRDRILPNQNTQ